MNRLSNRYLLMFFVIMCAMAFVVLFSAEAFAGEGASTGRKLWDNIMLWVNFGILVFFFIKYARRPLMNFLYGERQKIEETLNIVDEKIKKARSLMDAEADKLKDIDNRIQSIREGIIKLGKKEKEKIVEKAKATASQMIEDAKKESQYRLAMAKKRFSEEMLDIAISMAVEKLKKGISLEDNEKIVDHFTTDLNNEKGHFI